MIPHDFSTVHRRWLHYSCEWCDGRYHCLYGGPQGEPDNFGKSADEVSGCDLFLDHNYVYYILRLHNTSVYIYIYNISIYVYTYRERDNFRSNNKEWSVPCPQLQEMRAQSELHLTILRCGNSWTSNGWKNWIKDSFRNLSEIYRKEYRLDRNLVINFGDTSPFSPWVQLGLWVPWDSPHAQARWHWPTRAPGSAGSARCGLSHWSSLGQGTRDFRRFLVIGVPNFDPYLCWWIKLGVILYWCIGDKCGLIIIHDEWDRFAYESRVPTKKTRVRHRYTTWLAGNHWPIQHWWFF